MEWNAVLAAQKEQMNETGEEGKKLGRILGKDLRESITSELPAIVGTVVKYKEAFSLSPNELKKITDTWAEIGQTMVRDLRQILNSDLTPAMKAGHRSVAARDASRLG